MVVVVTYDEPEGGSYHSVGLAMQSLVPDVKQRNGLTPISRRQAVGSRHASCTNRVVESTQDVFMSSRNSFASVFLAVISCAVPAHAQIIGQTIVNNYSYIQPGMPNYGIAQGSIFIMGGTNDMTESTVSQGVPLQTTLGGVTVTVTVGNVTTQAIPYYVSPGQITAILPSKTPVGNATVTVTSGGQSLSATTTVVPSAFGLATVSSPAGGVPLTAAIAQDDNEGGQLLSQTNAANPGEYLTFWGTGLGAVSGDETQYQTPENLTTPIDVDVGGVSATVTYHGRSIYPGLDQINLIVPAGVSGCNVSVVVVTGGVPSNFATIPVAASGRICSDPALIPVTTSQYQTLLGLPNINVGAISLETLPIINGSSAALPSDSAYAIFQKYTAQQFASSVSLQVPSSGGCVVNFDLLASSGAPLPPLIGWGSSEALNAGQQINLNGPDGSLVLPFYNGGTYFEPTGASPAIVPPSGGTFTFSDGSGGSDIGTFTTSLSETMANPLVWTNSSSITAIDRTKDLLVTWAGGVPGSYVSIFGYSTIYQASPNAAGQVADYVYFACTAPLAAGQFTVPAAVLESLPSTGTQLNDYLTPSPNGSLYVASESIQQFSAPGLDLGLLSFIAGSGISVPFE